MQQAVLAELRQRAASLKCTWADWPAGRDEQARRWEGLRRIAGDIAGRKLDPELLTADHSLIESVRRAVKGLERRGMVETCHIWYDTRRSHDDEYAQLVHGSGLHCRLSSDEYGAVDPAACQSHTDAAHSRKR